jgi:hypothetical protein
VLVWSLGAAAACVYVAGRGGVVASSVATCVARGLRRGGASDGLRREFVAKSSSSTPTPRSRLPATKDELDGRRPPRRRGDKDQIRTDGTYAVSKATTRTRRLEVVALRVLRGQVELDQGHSQMILELLEIFDGTVLLPPSLRVEGLEELRVDPI